MCNKNEEDKQYCLENLLVTKTTYVRIQVLYKYFSKVQSFKDLCLCCFWEKFKSNSHTKDKEVAKILYKWLRSKIYFKILNVFEVESSINKRKDFFVKTIKKKYSTNSHIFRKASQDAKVGFLWSTRWCFSPSRRRWWGRIFAKAKNVNFQGYLGIWWCHHRSELHNMKLYIFLN